MLTWLTLPFGFANSTIRMGEGHPGQPCIVSHSGLGVHDYLEIETVCSTLPILINLGDWEGRVPRMARH